MEFTKAGKVTVTVGKDFRVEGTYKMDGNKLALIWKDMGKEETVTRTVVRLTDTELVLKDDKGKDDTLVRLKDK